jgi:hypothetical protein
MPYTPPPTHKASILWIFAAGFLVLAILAAVVNPVTGSFGLHGDLPELHWVKTVTITQGVQPGSGNVVHHVPYGPSLYSFWGDTLFCALLASFLAWKAPRTTAWPHWVGLILIFALMCNNIQLGLKELSMVATDKAGDYQYLWFLCVLHWLVGVWSLACMMPLLLFLRRELPLANQNPKEV